MNITNQLESIVNQLLEEIKTKLDTEIQASIVSQINSALEDYDFDSIVGSVADTKLNDKIKDFKPDVAKINEQLGAAGTTAIANIKEQVLSVVKQHIAEYDITPLVEETLKTFVYDVKFPKKSIDSSSIDFDELTLSGDHIVGGIIKNFASTGIEDQATQCQITILDTHVVVEKPILTSGIQVEGNIRLGNTLHVSAVNAENIRANKFDEDSEGFTQLVEFIQTQTLKTIADNGVIAPKLSFNDKDLITSSELAPSILVSNLRKVGTLQELQTRGETLLDNTLYVGNKRVGVNTLEPAYALTVWDGEVEVAINKVNQTRAFIGTHRPVAVTLGANGKENISLDPDGSVTINDLRLGALPLSTASSQPNWSGIAGEIVFNDSPKIGVPIGWVCLEGHRWAYFGLISE